MKNIHIIATEKPSRLQLNVNTKKLILFDNIQSNNESVHLTTQNIYITNDEEIKEGDYCIITDIESVLYGQFEKHHGAHQRNDQWKKIILTTDQSLDGVQAIDDEFLEWFVNNPSCEQVEVQRDFADEGIKGITYYGKYFLIIPKEEPKQETLEESNQTTAIRFLEWYRRKGVIYQIYLNASQLFEIFRKENYE